MVHLAALPGSPGSAISMDQITATAVADASALAETGFDAVLVENFGDAPFFADDVPDVTVSAMSVAIRAVVETIDLPVGVNVLRNDAAAALAIAAATGARFIRVNVLSGMMNTDQGPIVGRAAELARARAALAPDVAVLADVFVKHASPPPGLSLQDAAVDLWERGGADGVVVSGSGTARPTSESDLHTVRDAIPTAPLYVGSGASPTNVGALLAVADGVIVGSSLKHGDPSKPIDKTLAEAFVEAAS